MSVSLSDDAFTMIETIKRAVGHTNTSYVIEEAVRVLFTSPRIKRLLRAGESIRSAVAAR